MTEYHLITYADPASVAQGLAQVVAAQLAVAITEKKYASLAVPGGRTPEAFLRALSQADIPWQDVHIMPSDERFVPNISARANQQMIQQAMANGNAHCAHYISFWHPDTPIDTLAQKIAQDITPWLPLDVCILGMGLDMHTASLFPEADRLQEALMPNTPSLVLPMHAPNAPEPRLTLTLPVLQGARHRHLLITGEDKKAALEQAKMLSQPLKAPISAMMHAEPPLQVHYCP